MAFREYPAYAVEVLDGTSIYANIDLGFRTTVRHRLALLGVIDDNCARASEAMDYLRSNIQGRQLKVLHNEHDGDDAIMFFKAGGEWHNLATTLVDLEMAAPYSLQDWGRVCRVTTPTG